jgi:hypothetical protein
MGFHEANMVRPLVGIAVLASIAISAAAQSQSADEREIRALIARYDVEGESAVPSTADMIYWTGPFKRPTVGAEQRDPLPADLQPSATRAPNAQSERVPGSRRRVTTPIRLEIAKSGDLAYEYSNSEVRFDLRNGQQEVVTPASVLRVWKKDGGQWKIAAMFARPHYTETTASKAK